MRSSNPAPTRVHTGRKERTASSKSGVEEKQSGVEEKQDGAEHTESDDVKTVQR